jgi:hypothetical protein
MRINRLIEITSSELKTAGFKDIPTPILLSNAVTLALKTKGNCEILDLMIKELQARRETIDDVPASSYLTALVSLLIKGEDSREEKDKSLGELLGTDQIVGTVKRV